MKHGHHIERTWVQLSHHHYYAFLHEDELNEIKNINNQVMNIIELLCIFSTNKCAYAHHAHTDICTCLKS